MSEKTLKVRLFSKNVEMDERTREYILKRIAKMEKFLKVSLEYEVEVEMDKKGKFSVEIMIKTPKMIYRAEEISESVEGSTDLAVEDLQGQIVKKIDRARDLRKRGARSIKKE